MALRSYGVIPDATGRRLLLLRGADGWEIPRSEAPGATDWADVAHVNDAVGRRVGLEVTTLRPLFRERGTRFFELENHEPDRTPPDAAWFDRDEIERIALAEPEHRPILARCLDEREDDGGELRLPWARPGWFAVAASWMREELGRLGLEAGSVEQQRTWSISALLRAPTSDGDFYFKASAIVFAGEPALTRELALRHPGRVPELVAVDLERRWMLMRDFDGSALAVDTDVAPLCEALRAYAQIQLEWLDREHELAGLGCPDRGLDALAGEIDRVLGDAEALLPGRPEGLSPDELRAVPKLAERLREACDRLRELDLPLTLEHGDLHADNIRRREDGFLFYDWSDGCLSVPLFSLVPLLEFESLPDGAGELLRDAFLEPWTAHAPRERLLEAFELTRFLGLFHQAVSYYRIVEHTEPRARWEWERVFPGLVKRLLERE